MYRKIGTASERSKICPFNFGTVVLGEAVGIFKRWSNDTREDTKTDTVGVEPMQRGKRSALS